MTRDAKWWRRWYSGAYNRYEVFWETVADELSQDKLEPAVPVTISEIAAIRKGKAPRQSPLFTGVCARVSQDLRLHHWGWDSVDAIVSTLVPGWRP